MALNSSFKEFARIGLGMWQHGIDRPEAHEHGLGWCEAAGYAETTDLVMHYLMEPGAKRPDPEAIFTNRFAGKIKLGEARVGRCPRTGSPNSTSIWADRLFLDPGPEEPRHDLSDGKRIADPCRTRHPDGRADAAVLAAGLPVVGTGGRRRPAAPDAVGRATDRVSRQRGADRRARSPLPAPLRLAVLRPQRRGRPALHLSRLEVRHRRQLPRYAESAGRPGLPAQGQGEGLQGGRARRAGLRLYGRTRRSHRRCRRSRRCSARPTRPTSGRGSGECNWLQALEGDIDTSHFSFLHTGKVDDRRHRSGSSGAVPIHRPRPALPRAADRLGHDVRGLPAGAAGPRSITALPISRFRSGRCSRTAR